MSQGGSILGAYTQLNEEAIADIGRNYGFTNITYRNVASGIANSTYVLKTYQGKFVLTIFEQGEGSDVHTKETLDYLEKHNFLAPRRIRRANGAPDLFVSGKPTLIMEYKEGLIYPDMPTPIEHLCEIGATLAKLHKVPIPNFFKRNTRVIPTGWSGNSRMTDPNLRILIREVLQYQTSWKQLPEVLIHGDPFGDNFIYLDLDRTQKEHKIVTIDWATATRAPAIIDIAMALIGNCRNASNAFDPLRVQEIIKGYELERGTELSEMEKLLLPAAIKYSNALLAYKRHIKQDAQNPEGYKELLEFADRIPDSYHELISGPQLDLTLGLFPLS